MKSGICVFLCASVAALVLAISPAALGSGDQPVIVALGAEWPNTTLNWETLNGVITRSTAVPENLFPSSFVPAANGSVVFNDGNDPVGSGGIWIIRADGSAAHIDTNRNDYDPSPSTDGTKVVFARVHPTTESSDIYVMNSDGSGKTLVVSGGGTNLLVAPRFSPDGGSIAYACGLAPHATSAGRGCGPLMDGRYASSGVIRARADGTNPRMIVAGVGTALAYGGNPTALSWSSDGQWILLGGDLSVTRPEGNSMQTQLFAYRSDGSDLFNILDPTRQVTHEAFPWSPILEQFCGSPSLIYFVKTVDDEANEGNFSYTIQRNGTGRQEIFLSSDGNARAWGVCVLSATGSLPGPFVDATHVKVPSVRALGLSAAKTKLVARHLRAGTVSYRYSSSLLKNRVVAQSPVAGVVAHRTTKKGPPVNLVIGRGVAPAKNR